jgi:RNA polymerase sigma-54 factor
MKQVAHLNLKQNLALTPALQQAIKLLQLSTLDLGQEIQQALDSNLMLERLEESEPLSQEDPPPETQDDIPTELPVDANWNDIYDGAYHRVAAVDEGVREYLNNNIQAPPSLTHHLLAQTALENFSETDYAIAEHIIDGLDDDGYIGDWPSLEQELGKRLGTAPAQAETVLQRIQMLDPAGVAARDLSECLLLQLRQLPEGTPGREAAQMVAADCLELLGQRDYARLASATNLPAPTLEAGCLLIRALQPRPGAPFQHQETAYITPEIFVEKRRGRWTVSLNNDITPRLRINAYYRSLVRRADKSEEQLCLKHHLQEARFFLNNLRSRNETLLRVAQAIVEQQQGFFEHGEQAMKPLVLKDVAEQTEMHESTVSRATAHKYMQSPRGVFELKYFFSSGFGTSGGGSTSAVAIKAMIRQLVGQEPAGKPYSDSKIAQFLLNKGIKVARRTVAKYREEQHIPPSSERKHPG